MVDHIVSDSIHNEIPVKILDTEDWWIFLVGKNIYVPGKLLCDVPDSWEEGTEGPTFSPRPCPMCLLIWLFESFIIKP